MGAHTSFEDKIFTKIFRLTRLSSTTNTLTLSGGASSDILELAGASDDAIGGVPVTDSCPEDSDEGVRDCEIGRRDEK